MSDLTVVTYGGGEILRNIFNSIAILFNSKGGLVQPLMIITISCGAVIALSKAMFSSNADAIISKFFIPLVAITGFMCIPASSVHIEDVLKNRSYKVDHVPWLIAKTTELISSVGYKITDAVESVMHTPNDVNYNATGMVFGSETALDMEKYKITNAVFEQNLKRFAKQCVFLDISLNKYTLDDFKKSTNLWKFLEANSSNVRMISYTDPETNSSGYRTCQEAIRLMTPVLNKEKQYYAAQEIVRNLPLTFQALSGIKKEKEELISQQLMMSTFSGEINSWKFAKSRAHEQQKSTYLILGSLASNSLVTMRVVMEAIVYAAIIFIIPLSVLPGGLSFISNWLWLSIWIQLWPPFYAILNYIMHSVALSRAIPIFSGLSESEQGLSFFTSLGLSNLHDDIFALSGYLAASIPFISYAVIKGGVSSFMHLAGSMMTPAHSAATSAAAEQTSGNYSLSSVSFGQMSYGNTTGMQKNLAPSLSSGFFTENAGDMAITYGRNEPVVSQNLSKFKCDVSSDQATIASMQHAKQSAETFSEGMQQNYMESISAHGRNMADLSTHLAQSQNFADSISEREAFDIQESARFMQNQAASLAAQYGLSERECMHALMSTQSLKTGAGALLTKANPILSIASAAIPDISWTRDSSKDQFANEALNVVKSEEFQKHYQNVNDYATSHAHTSLNDEGIRLAEGVTHSLDEVRSSQEQFQVAKNHMDQISESASWVEQNSWLFKKNLNQDLLNFMTEKVGFDSAVEILTRGSDEQITDFIGDYISSIRHHHKDDIAPANFQDPQQAYQNASINTINREAELDQLFQQSHANANEHSLTRGDIDAKAQSLNTNLSHMENSIDQGIGKAKTNVSNSKSSLHSHLHSKDQSGHFQRLWNGPSRVNINAGSQTPIGWTD